MLSSFGKQISQGQVCVCVHISVCVCVCVCEFARAHMHAHAHLHRWHCRRRGYISSAREIHPLIR